MDKPIWDFENIGAERRELLIAPFDFDDLVTTIANEARNIRFKKEKGTHEAKGSWRALFWFDVTGTTFDRVFNSPYGYRAQYVIDPLNGREKNAVLIAALIDSLACSVQGDAQLLGRIRLSLASPHAKIWIEEDQHCPRTPELIIEICMSEWVKAAKSIHDRLIASDFNLTTKEVDRIYGVRAPVGPTLKVMGAWIAPNGELELASSKLKREEDIRAYGVS